MVSLLLAQNFMKIAPTNLARSFKVSYHEPS